MEQEEEVTSQLLMTTMCHDDCDLMMTTVTS